MPQFSSRPPTQTGFNRAAAPAPSLPMMVMEELMPFDILDLRQTRFACELQASDGAKADYDFLVDRANGIYVGRITVQDHGRKTLSELRAHRIGPVVTHDENDISWRIDRMTLDGRTVDTGNLAALSDALQVFLSYKNAAYPNGTGPAALFPRPAEATLPPPVLPRAPRQNGNKNSR